MTTNNKENYSLILGELVHFLMQNPAVLKQFGFISVCNKVISGEINSSIYKMILYNEWYIHG